MTASKGWTPRPSLIRPPVTLSDHISGIVAGAFTRDAETPREPAFLEEAGLLVHALPPEPEPEPEHDAWERNTIAMRVPVSMAMLAGPLVAGPETREEYDARQARKAADRAELVAAWDTYDAAVAALDQRTARYALDALAAVWNLHRPVLDSRGASPTCHGCDAGSYAEDRPEWPCSTVEALADALDVPLPNGYALWRPRPEGADQ